MFYIQKAGLASACNSKINGKENLSTMPTPKGKQGKGTSSTNLRSALTKFDRIVGRLEQGSYRQNEMEQAFKDLRQICSAVYTNWEQGGTQQPHKKGAGQGS